MNRPELPAYKSILVASCIAIARFINISLFWEYIFKLKSIVMKLKVWKIIYDVEVIHETDSFDKAIRIIILLTSHWSISICNTITTQPEGKNLTELKADAEYKANREVT